MSEMTDTAQRILDVAQALVQERGFNAVSYSDIGGPLGIRNASVHYHFPAKSDLGVALVRRYRQRTETQLRAIETATPSAGQRLRRYLAAYRTVIHDDGRICLCAVLAGDAPTLPGPMRREVQAFFDLNQTWLTQVLTQGLRGGEVRRGTAPDAAAQLLLATLEGAMLLARSAGEPALFGAIGRQAVEALLTG